MTTSSPGPQLSTAASACVTTVVSEQYVMEWSLEDLAELSAQDSIKSSDFTWSNKKYPMWRIFIYPAGLSSQSQLPAPVSLKISAFPRAGVHFQDEKMNEGEWMRIRISAITDDGKNTTIDQGCEFQFGWDNSGDLYFNLDRCFILNSVRKDGSLIICCEITIFSCLSRPYSNVTIDSPVLPKVSVPEGHYDAMKSLSITGFGSDFIVQVDTTELRVHRAILAAHSPVFRAMFDTGLDEAVKDRMNIVDFSPAAVKQLVNYLYTGAVEMLTRNEMAFELLGLAEKYEIRPLKHISEMYLCQNINSRNLISALIHSDLYKANSLKKICQEFITSNASLIFESKSWIDLKISHPDLAYETFEVMLRPKMLTADEDCGRKHGQANVHSRTSNSLLQPLWRY